MYEHESDVFITGSGLSGLYAAILLSKLGLTVQITDKVNVYRTKKPETELVLFSPRSLQLLHQFDLLTAITQKGVKHWKFDLYQNKGYGSQSVNVDQQSIRLWENNITQFSYSVSCEKSIVHDIFKEYLEKEEGIQVVYKQEIIDIQENEHPDNQDSLKHDIIPSSPVSTAELSLYYQYRPLPIPNDPQHNLHHKEHDFRSQKTIHLRDTDTGKVKVWKSQAIIAADGQSSLVRQKLGVALNKGVYSPSATRAFYTLQITVISTNFPGIRQISTVCKRKDILYIAGHQNKLYITFEHRPSWSKVSIDEEIPVQTAIDHIRAVLDPYKVEFGQIKSYKRWNGADQNSCEEYSVDSSYFFIGSSAQNTRPPGVFDTNTSLEHVQNLCWKLVLSLRNSASPQLLDTFNAEVRTKTEEAMLTSYIFTNLIGDYYKSLEEGTTSTNVNASHTLDLIYQLKRLKSCFIGYSAFSANNNILNYADEEDLSLSFRDESTNMSTPSFEFVAPPSPFQNSLDLDAAAKTGCLAPNAKLKPYTLFQLLLSTSSQPSNTAAKTVLSPTVSSSLLSSTGLPTPSSSPPLQHQQQISGDPVKGKQELSSKVLSVINNNSNRSRRRANSVTSGNNGSLSTIWSVLPIIQKNINTSLKKRHIITGSNNTVLTASSPTGNTSATTTTTTTPASVLISAERWKSIKTTHIQLLDRIQSCKKYRPTFTLLIFCGAMQETNNDKLQAFTRKLTSPSSFLYRYEDHSNAGNRSNFTSSSSTITTTDHRSSMSSINSISYTNRKSSLDTPRDSLDSYEPHHRYSISSISSSSSIVYPLQIEQKQQAANHTSGAHTTGLFSILYITSSTKNETVKYLNDTPPAMVHSTFPHGLDQVFLDHDQQCYKSYGVQKHRPEVVIIRPDDYIGTRVSMQYEDCFERLDSYFDSFLRPAVDMDTAAATVAAGFDF